MKCGPSLEPDDLLRLIDILNPNDVAGRLTLICRFGSDKVEAHLPKLIRAVQKAGRKVVWSCDPMHGNTISAASGYKTRPFERILKEVDTFFDGASRGRHARRRHPRRDDRPERHRMHGRRAWRSRDADLSDRYHTHCDPRLNADQSLELAFLVAERLKMERTARAPHEASIAAAE